MKHRARIFTLLDHYLPGDKSGGPVRSIANMVARIGHEFDFRIFSRDHDHTETVPYSNVAIDSWNVVGNATVFYSSRISVDSLVRGIREVQPDLIYANSFFSTSTIKLLLARRLGKLPAVPMVIATRGEFSPRVIRLKAWKKRPYIAVARTLGLLKDVQFHASTDLEKADIEKALRGRRLVHVAPDLPPPTSAFGSLPGKAASKEPGRASFIFVSRISRKKNLARALELLQKLKGEITYDIFGPVDDSSWADCNRLLSTMPANVKVTYHGAISHQEVTATLAERHFFFMPTMGENFCHAILEALASGTPAIISDQTPWLNLEEKGVGYALPLDSERWVSVLQACVDMDGAAYAKHSAAARKYAIDWISDPKIDTANVNLFYAATGRSANRAEA